MPSAIHTAQSIKSSSVAGCAGCSPCEQCVALSCDLTQRSPLRVFLMARPSYAQSLSAEYYVLAFMGMRGRETSQIGRIRNKCIEFCAQDPKLVCGRANTTSTLSYLTSLTNVGSGATKYADGSACTRVTSGSK
jgi:hypothetical protein